MLPDDDVGNVVMEPEEELEQTTAQQGQPLTSVATTEHPGDASQLQTEQPEVLEPDEDDEELLLDEELLEGTLQQHPIEHVPITQLPPA